MNWNENFNGIWTLLKYLLTRQEIKYKLGCKGQSNKGDYRIKEKLFGKKCILVRDVNGPKFFALTLDELE